MQTPIDRSKPKEKPKALKQVMCPRCDAPAVKGDELLLWICSNPDCEKPDADTPAHLRECLHCGQSLAGEHDLRKVKWVIRKCQRCKIAWVKGSRPVSVTNSDWFTLLENQLPDLHEQRREAERLAARDKARLARRDLESEPQFVNDMLDNDAFWDAQP